MNVAIALALGASLPAATTLGQAGLLGFFSYGVSLTLFVLALRHLGTARTGAYYSLAPFIGAGAAILLLSEPVTGAIPYDVPGVELTHVGDRCSFDTFLEKYRLDDPALRQLAEIVRGADTSRLDLTPQSPGLFAISLGLSAVFADDHEMLRHGLVMYDALYAWCKSCQSETHNWPPNM